MCCVCEKNRLGQANWRKALQKKHLIHNILFSRGGNNERFKDDDDDEDSSDGQTSFIRYTTLFPKQIINIKLSRLSRGMEFVHTNIICPQNKPVCDRPT